MNKQMKQHLETVVNSIVNEDTDAASSAFHEYLRMKTQSILLGEADDEECDDEEDKSEDKDEDKEDKKDEKKSKKSEDKDEDKDEDEEDEDK